MLSTIGYASAALILGIFALSTIALDAQAAIQSLRTPSLRRHLHLVPREVESSKAADAMTQSAA